MTGLADTGLIVAFLNRKDRHHFWAASLATVDEPLITCEAVLAEAVYLTGSAQRMLELERTGLVRLDFDLTANRARLEILAQRYADRSPDLADLCLICLSEHFPNHPVLTVDGDFLVYRRYQREVIPVIMPPQ